ncbi:MAG: hypothetical protein ACLQVY_14815 [Limisphaerales bacterium]
MADDYFPQEMTANERALGFQLLVLEGFGLPDPHVDLAQVPVVAKRLSPSDVLVKFCRDGLMFYSHRRFGRPAGAERTNASHPPGWFPVQSAIPVAEVAIAGFENGEKEKAPRRFGPAVYFYRELALH